MSPRVDRVAGGCAGLGLVTALVSPFLFGAVGLGVWQSLAWLWIMIGGCAWWISRRPAAGLIDGSVNPMPRVMVAFYALVAVQLVPLPPSLLRLVSPGSFAAHFIPPPPHPAWAPITASPIGTGQALLFIAGLHGLALAVLGGSRPAPRDRMRALFMGMAGVGALLALEGLVQSRSSHPFWLYGVYPVPGIGAHEGGVFGPYYNRDHYSNLMALAGSVAAGLLGLAIREGAFRTLPAFVRSAHFGRNVSLMVALILIIVANAASGSRGGLLALGVGVFVALGPALFARPRLAITSAGLVIAALFATGVPAAFMRMGDVDFEASRLLVWRDILRLVEFFPVFGCGIGAFAPAYWPYQRVVRYEYWPYVHNEYIQWLLEGGLLGLLLAAYVLRQAWIRAPRLVRDVLARPALAGLAAALAHALVDSSFRVAANASWTWLLVVCLAVLGAGPDQRRSVR